MIPLVGHVKELRDQKAIVDRVAAETMKAQGVKVKYLVGTMIEVPRGALTADQIAQEAEFFSFGTNDLTQLTFGFSRDDVGKFLRDLSGQEDPGARIRLRRSTSRASARSCASGVAARAQDAARPEARHLRRARRRSGVDSLLREGRARLRQRVAVPRPGRAARGGAGGAVGQGRRLDWTHRSSCTGDGRTEQATSIDRALARIRHPGVIVLGRSRCAVHP